MATPKLEISQNEKNLDFLIEDGPLIRDARHVVIVTPGLGNTLGQALPQVITQSVDHSITRLLIEQNVKIADHVEIPTLDLQAQRIQDTVKYSLANRKICTIVTHSLGALATIKALSSLTQEELQAVNVIFINPVHYALKDIFANYCQIEWSENETTKIVGKNGSTMKISKATFESLAYDPHLDLPKIAEKLGSITVIQTEQDRKYLIPEQEKIQFKSMVEQLPYGQHLSLPGNHNVTDTEERAHVEQLITQQLLPEIFQRYKFTLGRLWLTENMPINVYIPWFPRGFAILKQPPENWHVGPEKKNVLPITDTLLFDLSSLEPEIRTSSELLQLIETTARRFLEQEEVRDEIYVKLQERKKSKNDLVIQG